MPPPYFLRTGRGAGLFLLSWLLAATAWAQAPAWVLATATAIPRVGDQGEVTDIVADASGNLLVLGNFDGQVTLGSTTLTSAGGQDFYLGKYLPATNTWAWGQRGGGTGNDFGQGLALSGSSVYITGAIENNIANDGGVATADARGPAALPGGLPAGLYLVRAGAGAVRWVVE